ncbi:MAG: hypothetical protein L6Q93_04080 [Phycisphaerae bacterium]|nr:hypothetical protein [Phycisphaerae bacterium]
MGVIFHPVGRLHRVRSQSASRCFSQGGEDFNSPLLLFRAHRGVELGRGRDAGVSHEFLHHIHRQPGIREALSEALPEGVQREDAAEFDARPLRVSPDRDQQVVDEEVVEPGLALPPVLAPTLLHELETLRRQENQRRSLVSHAKPTRQQSQRVPRQRDLPVFVIFDVKGRQIIAGRAARDQ